MPTCPHYFSRQRRAQVQAVIGYQAVTVTGNQRQADLGSPQGLRAWRDRVIAQVKSSQGQGGCPLGVIHRRRRAAGRGTDAARPAP